MKEFYEVLNPRKPSPSPSSNNRSLRYSNHPDEEQEEINSKAKQYQELLSEKRPKRSERHSNSCKIYH